MLRNNDGRPMASLLKTLLSSNSNSAADRDTANLIAAKGALSSLRDEVKAFLVCTRDMCRHMATIGELLSVSLGVAEDEASGGEGDDDAAAVAARAYARSAAHVWQDCLFDLERGVHAKVLAPLDEALTPLGTEGDDRRETTSVAAFLTHLGGGGGTRASTSAPRPDPTAAATTPAAAAGGPAALGYVPAPGAAGNLEEHLDAHRRSLLGVLLDMRCLQADFLSAAAERMMTTAGVAPPLPSRAASDFNPSRPPSEPPSPLLHARAAPLEHAMSLPAAFGDGSGGVFVLDAAVAAASECSFTSSSSSSGGGGTSGGGARGGGGAGGSAAHSRSSSACSSISAAAAHADGGGDGGGNGGGNCVLLTAAALAARTAALQQRSANTEAPWAAFPETGGGSSGGTGGGGGADTSAPAPAPVACDVAAAAAAPVVTPPLSTDEADSDSGWEGPVQWQSPTLLLPLPPPHMAPRPGGARNSVSFAAEPAPPPRHAVAARPCGTPPRRHSGSYSAALILRISASASDGVNSAERVRRRHSTGGSVSGVAAAPAPARGSSAQPSPPATSWRRRRRAASTLPLPASVIKHFAAADGGSAGGNGGGGTGGSGAKMAKRPAEMRRASSEMAPPGMGLASCRGSEAAHGGGGGAAHARRATALGGAHAFNDSGELDQETVRLLADARGSTPSARDRASLSGAAGAAGHMMTESATQAAAAAAAAAAEDNAGVPQLLAPASVAAAVAAALTRSDSVCAPPDSAAAERGALADASPASSAAAAAAAEAAAALGEVPLPQALLRGSGGAARALAAAAAYLDAADLCHVQSVCSRWRELLACAAAVPLFRRVLRGPRAAPPRKRAALYLHILHDRPAWLGRGSGRAAAAAAAAASSAAAAPALSGRGAAGAYARLCAEAEAEAAALAARDGDLDGSSGGGGSGGDGGAAARAEQRLAASFRVIEADLERTWPAVSGGGDGDDGYDDAGALSEEDADGEAVAGVASPRSVELRGRLRRMLRAFALHARRVSYCQGMNFVALALLEASGEDEEEAFWALVALSERLAMEGVWCPGLHRLEFALFALERLLKQHVPELAAHMEASGVSVGMFASRWFVTLFQCHDTFGCSAAARVLDLFVAERWPALLRVAVAVLAALAPRLLPLDLEGILSAMHRPRAALFGVAPGHCVRARRRGGGGGGAGGESLCEQARAAALLQRAHALPIGDAALRELEAEFHLGADDVDAAAGGGGGGGGSAAEPRLRFDSGTLRDRPVGALQALFGR